MDDVQKIFLNKGGTAGNPRTNCAVLMTKALDFQSYNVYAEMMVVMPPEGKLGHNTRPGIAYNVQDIANYDVAYMK